MERRTFEGMTLGFSRRLPSTVASGHDIGISPHAVDQHFDWLATQIRPYQTRKVRDGELSSHPVKEG